MTLNAIALALLLGLIGYAIGHGDKTIIVKSERQVQCKPQGTAT